jgi:hypothetical protein
MYPRLLSRRDLRTLLLWSAPLAWLGCGGGGTDVVVPSLSITTSTNGVELDPDGYSLMVDGAQAQPIGLAATLTVDGLSDGQHTLELSGLASNCSIQGENPRTVTVSSGSTTGVAFAITCSATSGTIEVATVTSGAGSDPDGFALLLDGSDRGPIGVSTTASIAGLTPGTYVVGLAGLAVNCQVVGENPRSVTVTPGQTAQVPFSVTCTAPAPNSGTLEVTTTTSGSDQDPDGYGLRVDGGASQPIGLNATVALSNVSAGQHTVQLLEMATNCRVAGANPAQATVPSGGTTRVAFAITCTSLPPGTGSVQITAATSGSSPDPDGYRVSVDGGTGQTISVNGSRTVGNLAAGPHSVGLSGLATNCTLSGDNPRGVTITAGQTATVAFAITCAATGSSVNLRIERMYLTQSTQTLTGNVPLVLGRDGYLRVFVTASNSNTVRPDVRVRFFQNGAPSPVQTFTISASGSSTPTAVQEGTLGSSWNVRVPAALIQANTTVLADVDPGNTVAESNETDNSFPASGSPQALTVRSVPAAAIRFVPVRQSANGLVGRVTAENKDRLIEMARQIYPLQDIQTDVHPIYTTTTTRPFDPSNADSAWTQVLEELDVVRVAEGTNRNYLGVVQLDYSAGLAGMGYVGVPTALVSDEPSDVSRVVAHELGHNWGRWHSPCGNPGGLDPNEAYPYAGGRIGVYGMDVIAGALEPPSTPDIMGYCPDPWISDHTYQRVMTFRQLNPTGVGSSGAEQPCVLVWGHIENGRPVLEPAFQIVTRPSLPSRPGAYSVAATEPDGTPLFSLSFEAAPIPDDPRGSRHFAFAVPLEQARAARLSNLRVRGPGGEATATSRMQTAQLRAGARPDSVAARREAESVTLEWNADAHPMIMVRDPDTGEVLSFARGGNARVWTTKGELDLVLSDQVQSHTARVKVTAR